jgi:TetR/AcrR family transcriptional repressor of nem operon
VASPSPTGTRDKLLDAAEAQIHRQGYAATSIDRVIEEVGVTKGAFFYHFKTKQDLARALIDRFAARDREMLESSLERAEKLSDDPLQQLLIFVGLLVEVAEMLDAEPHPGCLFATYCFEAGLFDDATKGVIVDAMLDWRRRVADKLRAVVEQKPPRREVDVDSLADMVTVLFEGAFVVARTLPGRQVFSAQLRHYRSYLQLLFEG